MNMTVFYGILIPFSGTVLGVGVRILYEKQAERKAAKGVDRHGGRGNGCGVYMESACSVYGTVDSYGEVVFRSCGGRLLGLVFCSFSGLTDLFRTYI